MDSALDKNQSELGVLVLPVPLKMLPDADSLLDQIVDVLGQLWSHALALQNTQNLVASDESNLKLIIKLIRANQLITVNSLSLKTIVKVYFTIEPCILIQLLR